MVKAYILFILVLISLGNHLAAQVCHGFEPTGNVHGQHKSMPDSIGLAPTGNYDLVYHRISVSVNPAVYYIKGNVCSYFKPLSSVNQVAFDLSDTLTVDSVCYRGQRLYSFTHLNNAVTIRFTNPIRSLDSVTIFYQGAPARNGYGSFNTGMHDSIVPVLWTLSEPYGGRDWFPGKMTLTDKVDSLDFYITIPVGNRAASNGLLVDTVHSGNMVTYHWQHRYPIANYLIGMAVTNYAAYEDTVHTQYGDIHVLNYCYPENESDWRAESNNTAQALQLYSNLFGAYPFIKEKYGHAQFNYGGGMEHQTMSFVYNAGFELINHEMAHQWFGDKLTCGSWADIWLNEGFATYLSGICYQYLSPTWWLPFRNVMLQPLKTYAVNGSVYCTDTVSVPRIFSSALSYKKGAGILHMLRWQLGDSIFFSAIRSYLNDDALAYSFTKTLLLEQHIEHESGRDFSAFFQKWVYGQGYPTYALDWAQKGGKVSGRLSQSTSDPSVTFYEMDVPVQFWGEGRDTTVIMHHTYSGQEYTFDISFAIDSVRIDPELWLISGNNVVRKLPDISTSGFITLYPNPVSDIMTIWYDSRTLNALSYSIWDMQGQKVMEDNITTAGDYHGISLAGLERGIYFIRIQTDHVMESMKIVKY